jgi:hypothetical protein
MGAPMTLIMSLVRHEYALQVADRKVTMPDGSDVNDDTIKSVVFSNLMVFSFTGLAYLNQQTDSWLADELVEVSKPSVEEACNCIAVRATEICRKLHVNPINKRLAFVGVGFEPDVDSVKPVFIRISNFHNEHGQEAGQASDTFTIHKINTYDWWATPAWLTDDQVIRLRRIIHHVDKRQVGHWPYVRVFGGKIRDVAAMTNRVGRPLTVCFIPRPSVVGAEMGISWDDMTIGAASGSTEPKPLFMSITEDSKYGFWSPHYVSPGKIRVAMVRLHKGILTDAERIKFMADMKKRYYPSGP